MTRSKERLRAGSAATSHIDRANEAGDSRLDRLTRGMRPPELR